METKQEVSPQEQTQVIESLFDYLKGIHIGVPISIEYLGDKTPSIVVKQSSTAYKTNVNIIGGYDVELPFVIYYRAKVDDQRSIFSITKPLNIMADIFAMETANNFPNLKLKGYIPQNLEMVSTPVDDSEKENNTAVFMAMYKLTYKKKANIAKEEKIYGKYE